MRNIQEFYQNLKTDPTIKIPWVRPDLCGTKVRGRVAARHSGVCSEHAQHPPMHALAAGKHEAALPLRKPHTNHFHDRPFSFFPHTRLHAHAHVHAHPHAPRS